MFKISITIQYGIRDICMEYFMLQNLYPVHSVLKSNFPAVVGSDY